MLKIRNNKNTPLFIIQKNIPSKNKQLRKKLFFISNVVLLFQFKKKRAIVSIFDKERCSSISIRKKEKKIYQLEIARKQNRNNIK